MRGQSNGSPEQILYGRMARQQNKQIAKEEHPIQDQDILDDLENKWIATDAIEIIYLLKEELINKTAMSSNSAYESIESGDSGVFTREEVKSGLQELVNKQYILELDPDEYIIDKKGKNLLDNFHLLDALDRLES